LFSVFDDVLHFCRKSDILFQVEFCGKGFEVPVYFLVGGKTARVSGERAVFGVTGWSQFKLFKCHQFTREITPQVLVNRRATTSRIIPSTTNLTLTFIASHCKTLLFQLGNGDETSTTRPNNRHFKREIFEL